MLDTARRSKAEVISALREELSERGLDAFIVPRFDAHQGEYVAPHDERLAYVTGFKRLGRHGDRHGKDGRTFCRRSLSGAGAQ